MSVIIRLQNLPWSANALDIRQFFHGLSIPEGGVHIVGGEQGDAFIAFSTDEDARQAFGRSNGKIKEIKISLMLSSRTEMQKVIETARAQSYAAFMQAPAASVPMPAAVPLVPAAVPHIKKDSNKERETKEKREKKRSRSRSRDRRDRDRRDRKYRDRTRSRSRERRDRKRRDRSRSRQRSRDRDRKTRDRKRSPDCVIVQKEPKKVPEVWASQKMNEPVLPIPSQTPNLFSNFSGTLDNARRNLSALSTQLNSNKNNHGALGNFGIGNMSRDSWSPQNNKSGLENDSPNFLNRSDDKLPNLSGSRSLMPASYQNNKRYPRNFSNNDQYQNENDTPFNQCIRLQPFYGGYGDIRRFFHGSFISNVGIKFINDDFGHRTGIVYIQFGHQKGKLESLKKNGEVLNGVTVEVVHIDDEEFENAIDRYQPDNFQSNDSGHRFKSKNITKYFNRGDQPFQEYSCVTVNDLPTYVKEQDILKLFSPRPLLSLFVIPKNRGGHIAYVKFGSAEEAKKACEEGSHIVEGKQVTVKPCDDKEFEAISQQHSVDIDSKVEEEEEGSIETDCLNMTQLPLQTSNVDITDFFSDIGLRPTKIHLISNRSGFTGQAFCEFESAEQIVQALSKDNAAFGSSQVSIVPIKRDEMEAVLKLSQIQPLIQPLLAPRVPNSIGLNRPFYPRGGFDAMSRGGPRFMGHRTPRPRFVNAIPSEDALPGCTVFMDNVPYKAGTNEILDFFEGYDMTNNVSRRFNANNTPSAEAKVVFNSAEEAYRAVQDKNGQKIWERPIYLKQV